MDVTTSNLQALDTAIRTMFNESLLKAETTYGMVSMTVSSNTRQNVYPNLSDIPGMREWLGERQINRLARDAFTILNRKFENTIAVPKEDIEDDQVGLYSSLAGEFGQTAAELADDIVWELFPKGFTTLHHDGQNFFDTDHPIEDKSGNEVSVSNFSGGTGTAWYLIDDSRHLKPTIFQDRTAAEITPKTALVDDNVFHNDEFLWGARRRCAAGYGAWQTVHASKQTLGADSYEAARVAMAEMKGHRGREMNLRGRLLVVPPALEGVAKELLMSERNVAGATNKWRDSAKLHVESRLAGV